MARGRRPLPSPLKLIRGNPSKRPLPQGEPQPARDMPEPPAFLGMIGLAEWHRLAPELHRIGVLTMADRATLSAYCKFYERWAVAEAQLHEELLVTSPSGYLIQHALVGVANRAADLMLKYMVELGLTPASRVRLATGAPPVDDPLEQFLAHRKPRR